MTRIHFVCFIGFLLAAGCSSEPVETATPVTTDDGFETTSAVEGVDVGKYDQAIAITEWQVQENATHVRLEGLNAAGVSQFAAIMEQDPMTAETRVNLKGKDMACDVSLNLATNEVLDSTCTAEQMAALEIPALQLVETFNPLVADADGKADDLLTKAACVGAGVGAALLTAFAWEFVSAAAVVGGSSVSTPLVISAGGSLIGAAAVCYDAFAGGSEMGDCVDACDDDLDCLSGCIDTARAERIETADDTTQATAGELVHCLEHCEGDSCAVCDELI